MGRRIAIVASDRKSGGIQTAIELYLRALERIGSPIDLLLNAGSPLYQKVLGHRSSYSADLHTLSSVDQFCIRRFGYLPNPLRKLLTSSSIILSNNHVLCQALKSAGRPVIAISHTDKWKGAEHADRVVCLSQAALDAGARAGLARSSLVHLPHYFQTSNEVNNYAQRSIPPLIVSAAGRFVTRKGLDDFVRAAAIVRQRHSNVAFWLAGTGENEDALRKLSADQNAGVEFKGWLNLSELAMKSHIFCMPSREESFGFALCQMMDKGVPCVVSETNGPLEIIGPQKAALVFPIGDFKMLASHICDLIESVDLRNSLSDQAFARIRSSQFTSVEFDRRLAGLINSLSAIPQPSA